MNLIEIAVYALVLSGGGPALCQYREGSVVACSNGLEAEALSPTEVRFSDGITVRHPSDGFPVFSNGITSRLDSAGWLRFSNGIAVRRLQGGAYAFDTGVTCKPALPDLVDCGRLSP